MLDCRCPPYFFALLRLFRRYTDRVSTFTSAGVAELLRRAAEAYQAPLPGLEALCLRELELRELEGDRLVKAAKAKEKGGAAAPSWKKAVLGPTNAAGGGAADGGDGGEGARTYGAHGAAVLATVNSEPGSSDGGGAELCPAASKRARRR